MEQQLTAAEEVSSPTLKQKDQVIEKIKKNYDLAALCCIPFIEKKPHRVAQVAKKLGVSSSQYQGYTQMLFESQIWVLSNGDILPNFDPLDLGDISVSEFLGMTVHIVSRISEERPSSFETMTLATNRDLVSEFNKKVNQALNELYEKSQNLDQRSCLFSWTHAGLIEYQKSSKLSEEDKKKEMI